MADRLAGARRLARRVGRRLGRGTGGTRRATPRAATRKAAARTPLVATPGFELAAVAVLRNEASYIEEWLCHHMAVGVQHFFLYDNASTDDIHDVLTGYVNRGLVTLVYFPLRGLQRDAYNHALRLYGSASEWLACIDIDEFLVPARDERVPAVLRRYPAANQVLVCRKEFCFSGHRARPDGLVTEAYTLASRDVPRVGRAEVLAKPIVRSRAIWRMGVHSAETVDRATVNTAGEPSPEGRPAIPNPTFEHLQINHYYTKSWEEFAAKLARVNTSTHAFQLPEVPFDIAGEPDHVVDRWVPRTRALLEEMRTLSPRPYRYGSHLALGGFPRSDQFSVQAASVVTNEIAGLDRPRKQRAFEPLPLPEARGAVARAEDGGYAPAPGRLLGSVHARHQIAWLDGEVAWALPDGAPSLAVEGGTLRRPDESSAWRVEVSGPEARLAIGAGGRPLRQHALLFAVGMPTAARVTLSVRESSEGWQDTATLAMPDGGTYLGFVALDDRPRTLDAVRISVPGVPSFDVFDLALVTYG